MKKVILIIVCFCCFLEKTKAQTFTVGDMSSNYNLVNKTFTVSGGVGYVVGSSDSYKIDIDGDVNYDVCISSYYSFTGGGNGSTSNGIMATSPNNTEFVYTFTNSPTCAYSRVIDNVPFATPLDPSLNWSVTPTSWNIGMPAPYVYYYYHKPSIGATIICGQQTNPFYIGFRKILPSNDTIYGWALLDSNSPGTLISYAYTCGSYTATPPTSAFTNTVTKVCVGDSLTLTGTPAGGIFTGVGVSGNIFHSAGMSAGSHPVFYTLPNPNGCLTSPDVLNITVNVYVNAVFTNTETSVCNGDSLVLTGSPPGGTFSGAGVSGNTFYSSITGLGPVNLYYSYSNYGCVRTNSLSLSVNSCVGIKELNSQSSPFKIFPNPNNGEFEIKGTKEEIIFVSNELGQLLDTKNLNSQNNYSVKINNLQNGIYFVGNNYSKQKIVVIK